MDRIGGTGKSHASFSRPVPLSALQEFLSDAEIETICRQLGHTWRDRVWDPATTVRSIVYRGLYPDKSIQAVMAEMASLSPEHLEPTPAGWCQARSRLPEAIWKPLIENSVERVLKGVGDRYHFMGRPVYLVDGSTVSMPDEPELVDAFGYADTKHGPSRFPVARITFITHAGAEVVCDYRLDAYRTGEDTQFRAMWDGLPPGSICIGDKKFCSFYNLAKLRQRRVDVLAPLHQRRHPKRLIAQGRRIGQGEWIVPLTLAAQLRRRYDDPALPDALPVRLIRVRYVHQEKRRVLWLVTTLLDPGRYPRTALAHLYRRRWGIETRIGSLKTSLEMNVLRSQTVANIRIEIAATVLAHNLTWTIIHQAARHSRTPADRISFVGTIHTVLAFSHLLPYAPESKRNELYGQMLLNVAHHKVPFRPHRVEPRAVKRDHRRYPFLKTPRQEARKCLS